MQRGIFHVGVLERVLRLHALVVCTGRCRGRAKDIFQIITRGKGQCGDASQIAPKGDGLQFRALVERFDRNNLHLVGNGYLRQTAALTETAL